MITPLQIYWILKLDAIHTASCIMFSAGLVLTLICGLGVLVFSDDYNYIVSKRFSNIITRICVPLVVIGGLVSVFIPTTKQMVAIHVVPAIVNNERVQNIGNKALDISEDLLKLLDRTTE